MAIPSTDNSRVHCDIVRLPPAVPAILYACLSGIVWEYLSYE